MAKTKQRVNKIPWALGVDVGSAYSKAAIVRSDSGEVFYHIAASRGDFRAATKKVTGEVLKKAGINFKDVASIVATGVGAASVGFSSAQVSEISCVGRGAKYLFPSVGTVIDIGDQASRIIKVDREGKPTSFVVSEKCAAGSGRFLQLIARVLQVNVSEIGELSLKAEQPVAFSTNCAVFAESETISRIAEGAKREDILAGIHKALAAKVVAMVERAGLEKDLVIAGGGAKDIGLVKSIEQAIAVDLLVPPEPQTVAALGAWLIASEMSKTNQPEVYRTKTSKGDFTHRVNSQEMDPDYH
jgi:predicted CoA-substrate-specific enzyme activase